MTLKYHSVFRWIFFLIGLKKFQHFLHLFWWTKFDAIETWLTIAPSIGEVYHIRQLSNNKIEHFSPTNYLDEAITVSLTFRCRRDYTFDRAFKHTKHMNVWNEHVPSARIKTAHNTSNLLRNPLPHKLETNSCGQCENHCAVFIGQTVVNSFVFCWVFGSMQRRIRHVFNYVFNIRHGNARLKSKIAANVKKHYNLIPNSEYTKRTNQQKTIMNQYMLRSQTTPTWINFSVCIE